MTQVLLGDCREVLPTLPDASIDAVVTDPPYELAFMGKHWDASGIAYDVEMWRQCARVLKPGGHLLVFGGTRTSHRLTCAIDDAGFEIRDTITWLYGSGFPKSLDVSKAIDRAAGVEREVVGVNDDYLRRKPNGMKTPGASAYGYSKSDYPTDARITAPATDAARQWQGWGTALKPASEPVIVARKPLAGTVAANVLTHGVGALNVDGCRVAAPDAPDRPLVSPNAGARFVGVLNGGATSDAEPRTTSASRAGRWPSNVVLSHSPDCAEAGPCADGCPVAELDAQSGERKSGSSVTGNEPSHSGGKGIYSEIGRVSFNSHNDNGGASRFFPTFRYQAKAPARERPKVDGVAHPTVKPLALMRWLVRLVTPPGGVVLDPFAGSGTTVEACLLEGFGCVAIERERDYLPLIDARVARVQDCLPLGAG